MLLFLGGQPNYGYGPGPAEHLGAAARLARLFVGLGPVFCRFFLPILSLVFLLTFGQRVARLRSGGASVFPLGVGVAVGFFMEPQNLATSAAN